MPYSPDTRDAFNLLRKTRDWEKYDRELAAKMPDVLLAFARTGNPSTAAVDLPRYNIADEQSTNFATPHWLLGVRVTVGPP